MVKDQLKCDAPRLGIGSDVLDLPSPTNSHHQDDYNFHKGIPIIKAFKNATVTGLAVDPSVMLFCLVKFIF